MYYKIILTSLFFASFSLSAKGLEYEGVDVKMPDDNGKIQNMQVKRNIPKECKELPVANTLLWTGNFAHKDVPEACKSTYVHTKGKLLPMRLYDDLDTYGELEVLSTLKEMQDNKELLLIDSRKEVWFKYMTIPGAINMPFHYFSERDGYVFHFEHALKYLGVTTDKEGDYDFSKAKTLVIFCNGPWCTQSPSMIFALIDIDYPLKKLKWYRGGMQDWLSAGMTSTRKSE